MGIPFSLFSSSSSSPRQPLWPPCPPALWTSTTSSTSPGTPPPASTPTPPPSRPSTSPPAPPTPVGQTLISVFGIALAERLKETSLFQLPDLPTSSSCLADFQSKLSSLSPLPPRRRRLLLLRPLPLRHRQLHLRRDRFHQGLGRRLGNSTPIDTACRPDLTQLTYCDACAAAGIKVQGSLDSIGTNSSIRWLASTILYCTLPGSLISTARRAMGLSRAYFSWRLMGQPALTEAATRGLVFGVTVAGVAVGVMFCLLGLFFWYDRVWRVRRTGFDGSGPEGGVDLEESGSGSRIRPRPNTGSIWFKIRDLEEGDG
ncbi:hypothetical protein MLD38_023169 [Melastoma candidum]|uniref:Uncharacterized protein n=1 Tax=Melastoma candidum TaxID=119954 RepID=A0ACB9QM77_9MYRT|nr:hypothetical protein MLD38_023169 [Melastoma candidum]